jgi:hypothetical protein
MNLWNPSDPDVFRSQPTGSAGGSARFRVTAKESQSVLSVNRKFHGLNSRPFLSGF